MSQRPLATPRILLVDDHEYARREMSEYLLDVHDDAREQRGIGVFKLDEAEGVRPAERLLTGAERPYDLAVVDLRLPINKYSDGTEDINHGRDLLRFIRETKTAKGVIVISNYDDYQNVVESFRSGALDFVSKPVEQEYFEPAVLNALERVMAAESDRVLNQRVRDLVAYAEIGLAYSFWVVFKGFSDDVKEAANGIEKYVRERYGLEREKDKNDTLMLRLSAHRKAVAEANREWAKLQAELSPGGKAFRGVHLGRMMRDIREGLLPSLVVRRVAFDPPDFGDTAVTTFERDVGVVLREIVAGALGELPDYGEGGEINVSFRAEDTRVAVRFEDTLEPIREEQMKAINDWQRILPDAEFGRAWGLSVAQHVALRGGGSLTVESDRGRNVVTYHIPLADHADHA